MHRGQKFIRSLKPTESQNINLCSYYLYYFYKALRDITGLKVIIAIITAGPQMIIQVLTSTTMITAKERAPEHQEI